MCVCVFVCVCVCECACVCVNVCVWYANKHINGHRQRIFLFLVFTQWTVLTA